MPQGIVITVQPPNKGKDNEKDTSGQIEVIAIKSNKHGITKGETYLFIGDDVECFSKGKGDSVKIGKVTQGNQVELDCKTEYKCKKVKGNKHKGKLE